MKRRRLTVFLLAFVFVTLSASLAGAAGDAASKELEIQNLLLEKIGEDAAGIRVTVDRTTAILTGTVPTRSAQELAEEVAFSVDGIKKIDNRVKVNPSSPGRTIDQETADAGLETKVKRHLYSELGKRARKIEVEAVDGVVSLRGTLPDESRKKIALDTAGKTEGVQRVIDLIKVK